MDKILIAKEVGGKMTKNDFYDLLWVIGLTTIVFNAYIVFNVEPMSIGLAKYQATTDLLDPKMTMAVVLTVTAGIVVTIALVMDHITGFVFENWFARLMAGFVLGTTLFILSALWYSCSAWAPFLVGTFVLALVFCGTVFIAMHHGNKIIKYHAKNIR